MLIKPETRKYWEDALSHFENVDELIKVGDFKKATNEATLAFIFGQRSIDALSKELKMPDLTELADNVLHDFLERIYAKPYTPKENIEWARKILKRLSAALPPDTLPPFRD
jgi:hypothetical protein